MMDTVDEIVGALSDETATDLQIGSRMGILVHRLEDAFMGSKKDLVEQMETMSTVFRRMLQLDPEVRDGILGDEPSKFKTAFVLGQLEFMTHVLNHSASHRAEDDFMDKLLSEPMFSISKKLLEHDWEGRSVLELVADLNTDEQAVRAAVRAMVEMGAADFRYSGQKAKYFLTHTGAGVIKQKLAGE
jgi:hypothetical protein